jgi:5-methylthioadenosine/S-adenosylhomocysteine deaminase
VNDVAPDLLVSGGDIVTMNSARDVLAGGTVAIGAGRIVAVGATSELRRRWPDTEVLDATGCVVTPGMINAHQHLGNTLSRSCIPDDLVPGASIFDWSVPLHAATGPDAEELSAAVGALDCARNGVTTVIEAGTVAHPDRIAAGMRAVGLRGTVGRWGWDIEQGPFTAPADETLDAQRQMLDAFPPGATVFAWVTLVGHSLASDDLLVGASELARSRGVGMTMHISPTRSDPDVYLERTGRRPVAHLEHLGVLGPHLLLAHAVWIDDGEAAALLRTRTAVAYTPWAYLRLGQGVSSRGRHAELFVAGGRVALGCDASNAGDTTDLLRAAALTAGLAKDVRIDPTWFGAADAFEMATIRGAEAVGLDDLIGSLEPGKRADLVVHDATRPEWTPRGDVALQLVWGADGRSVRDVLVDGRFVVREFRCVTVDERSLHIEANRMSAATFARAGIEVPHRWPIVPSA